MAEVIRGDFEQELTTPHQQEEVQEDFIIKKGRSWPSFPTVVQNTCLLMAGGMEWSNRPIEAGVLFLVGGAAYVANKGLEKGMKPGKTLRKEPIGSEKPSEITITQGKIISLDRFRRKTTARLGVSKN